MGNNTEERLTLEQARFTPFEFFCVRDEIKVLNAVIFKLDGRRRKNKSTRYAHFFEENSKPFASDWTASVI